MTPSAGQVWVTLEIHHYWWPPELLETIWKPIKISTPFELGIALLAVHPKERSQQQKSYMIGVSVLYNNQKRIINAQDKVQRSIIIIKQNFDNYTKGFIYRKCLW